MKPGQPRRTTGGAAFGCAGSARASFAARADAELGLNLAQVVGDRGRADELINTRKVAKHFITDIGPGRLSWRRDEEKIAAETALDGIYVIRTSVPGADPGVTDHLRQASTRWLRPRPRPRVQGVPVSRAGEPGEETHRQLAGSAGGEYAKTRDGEPACRIEQEVVGRGQHHERGGGGVEPGQVAPPAASSDDDGGGAPGGPGDVQAGHGGVKVDEAGGAPWVGRA